MKFSVLAFLAATLTAPVYAATCPADAPEGYKWLSGYVDEFKSKGTVSSWFTDSFKQHPQDDALRALDAYFEAGGDVAKAKALYAKRYGSYKNFDAAMACAKVQ